MAIASIARKALRPKPKPKRAEPGRAPVRQRIPRRQRRHVERIFTDLFGRSPSGKSWSFLVERYPERFRDYLEQGLEESTED
jgi:hypothetical protein